MIALFWKHFATLSVVRSLTDAPWLCSRPHFVLARSACGSGQSEAGVTRKGDRGAVAHFPAGRERVRQVVLLCECARWNVLDVDRFGLTKLGQIFQCDRPIGGGRQGWTSCNCIKKVKKIERANAHHIPNWNETEPLIFQSNMCRWSCKIWRRPLILSLCRNDWLIRH